MIKQIAGLYELPKNWTWTTVSEIGEVITGTTPQKACQAFYGPDYPFFKPTDLNAGYYTKESSDHLSQLGIEQARLLPEKAILVTCIGATIGKTGFIRTVGACNQQINAIIARNGVLPEFIYFWSISREFQKQISKNASATTLPILNKRKFEKLSVPLAPFKEQNRIVQKVELLFSFLDAGVAQLRLVQGQLKRYRQAVLKAAFEGKLTPQNANDGVVLEGMRKVWEEKELLIKGRKIRKEIANPLPLDEKVPFSAPRGWLWVRLIDLIALEKNGLKRGPFGGSLKKQIFKPEGFLVYEQKHAIYNDFSYAKYFISQEKYEEMIDFSVEPGDLIISCSGTIGKIAEVPTNARKGIINQALLKIKLNKKLVSNGYFIYFFNSSIYQSQIFEKAKGSAMQNMVGMDELKNTVILLPPIEEQKHIVSALDYHFSVIKAISTIAGNSTIQSTVLRQSILKAAFTGQLVPQNPADEPAERLLECIKAERIVKKRINQVELSKYVK